MPATSIGVENQEALAKSSSHSESDVKDLLTPEEREAQNFHIYRINKAKEMRLQPHRKFDGLNLIADYYSNEDAANSYLRPKRNDDEVRVVGGTTEKRIESMVNELLSMNQQPELQAMDKYDLEVRGLARVMEDTVIRTQEIEKDEDVRKDAIHELISQRVAYIEEVFLDKNACNLPFGMCKKRLRTSLEVFLGDVTMPMYRLQEQPYIVIYDCTSYWNAKKFFDWSPKWDLVRPGNDTASDVYGPNATFRLGILSQESVEIVKYMSVLDNEYQVYVNGVPMFPVGTKLPFKKKRYPLAAAIPKRMSAHFAYGRPQTAALKYLQGLNDETVRNIIRKFRQAIEPPKAVEASNHIYSRDIFEAGKVTYGVNADAFKNLVDHKGVTEAEISVLNLIKSMQDEIASRGNTSLGIPADRKETATATIEQQKQAIKMLGLLVLAWDGLVRDYTQLRIDNIIENMLDPIGHDIDPTTNEMRAQYRRFTLKNQAFENGRKGDRIIQFSDRALTDKESMDLEAWEDSEDKLGRPVRTALLDVRVLKNHEIYWKVKIVTKPNESGDLDRLMFENKLAQSQNVSQVAGRPLNGEKIVNEFQETWRLKDWFLKPEEGMEGMMGGMPGGGMGQPMPGGGIPGGDQMMAGMKSALSKGINPSPNIRTAVGAVENTR